MGCEDTSEVRKGICLIVGCGYVGVRLAQRRIHQGPVWALVRSVSHAEALNAEGLSAMAVDLDAPGPMALPSPSALVYMVPPPSHGTGDPRLQRFLEGLDGRSLQGVVYLSTTGVYGSAAGGEVDENTPPAPADEAGARRLAAETVVASWCAARSIRCVVLRVPGIYGPHRLPLDRLKGGEPVLRPEDAGPGNRIHVEDLVTVCEAALEQAVAGVIPVGDGNHASIGAFMERVAALGGLPPPRRVTWGEAQREISPGLLAYLQSSRRVLTHRMRQELGVTPRYTDLDAGICASLQEMGLFSSAER